MKNNNPLSRLNSSKLSIMLICALIFILMLYCNIRTNLVADDFRYFFNFSDDSRINNVADIFSSMAAHRHIMNGRVVAHFLVQLFLLLPSLLFKLVNSLMFLALIMLIYRLAIRSSEHNALLLCTIFGCIWLLQPAFGQVFLWLTGSVNYLWCAVICLLYLSPFLSKLIDDREPEKRMRILLIISSPFVGAYSENASVALIFMLILIVLICTCFYKQALSSWMLLSLLLCFCGFMYMMLAPAEAVNKSAEFSVQALLNNFIETARCYLLFLPLVIGYAPLLFFAVRKRLPQRLILCSLVLFLGSLAGHFVLMFAMYCALRSTYITLTLLLAASALLFAPLFKDNLKLILCAISTVCLIFTAMNVYKGVNDIRTTHYLLSFNESIVEDAIANGERIIYLPRPYPSTAYSALDGLAYLGTGEDSWSSKYMALYYCVDEMIAY